MIPKPEDLSITKKGIFLVCIPLVSGTIFIGALILILYTFDREAKEEARNKTILSAVQKLRVLTSDFLTAHAQFLCTGGDALKTRYEQKLGDVNAEFDILEHSISDDRALLASAQEWHKAAQRGIRLHEQIDTMLQPDSDRPALPTIVRVVRHLRRIARDLAVHQDAFISAIEQRSNYKVSSSKWQGWIFAVLGLFLAFSVGISVALARFFSHSMGARLATLVDNNFRLASNQPLNPPLQGKDELAKLDQVFHETATRLLNADNKEKRIIEEAQEVICTLDEAGRITAVNPASLNCWGYRSDDLLGRYIASVLVSEDIDKMRATMTSLSSGNTETTLVTRIIHGNGSTIYALWSIFWSKAERSFFCVVHDVTEKQKAEELLKERDSRLRLILESIPIGLVISNDNALIETTNARVEQMFGFSNSELHGQPISNLLVFDSINSATDVMQKLKETAFLGSVELDVQNKDSTKFPAELTLREFFFRGDRKLLTAISDITARREIERLKQEFVSMVSHDLRTPLTLVLMTMERLHDGVFGELNQLGQKRVSSVQDEVERLMQLIDGLIDMEKMQSGRLEINKEAVDVCSVISRSLRSVGYLAEKNQIQIVTHLSPCEVFADGALLVQVVVNLLANAIKFSPAGSTMSVWAQELPGAIEVKVQDQGRGVPALHRQSIFDRFKQIEQADRTEKKGSGLGLAICKSIVDAHGGTIGVESELNKGSTFWFRIPDEE